MTLKEDEAPITAAIFFESVNILPYPVGPMALLVKDTGVPDTAGHALQPFSPKPVPGRLGRLDDSIFTFLPSIHFNCMIRNGEINPFTSTTWFYFPDITMQG